MPSDQLLKVLLVDDDPLDRKAIQRRVAETDFPCQLTTADSCEKAFKYLRDAQFDIILLDYQLGDGTGLEILNGVDDTPVIFITGQGNEAVAVEAMQHGAYDYLIKDVARDYLSILLHTIQNAVARKQTEEQLRLTQFALDHAADPIYWVREDGGFSYVNQAACQLLGYSHGELLLMSVSEIDPDIPTEVWPARWQEMKNADRLTFESHHRTKDGRRFPVEITTNHLTNGTDEFVWAYVHDITERKRVEEELRQREQQLRCIHDSAADPLFYLQVEPGPHYRFLTVNDAFLRATGLTEEQIVGNIVNEVIPEPALTLVRLNYEQAIREKRIVRWEETSQYPAGLKTGSVSIAPVFDDEGNCTHLVGTVHDVTERKRAEETLNALLTVTSEVTGDEFFACVTKVLTDSLGMSYAHVGELIENDHQRIRTIGYERGHQPTDDTSFDLSGTPCKLVIGKTFQIYRGKLWEQFPEMEFLRTKHIRFYVGAPIFSRTGKPLGVICGMSDREQPELFETKTLLTLLAARCGAEIERRRAVQALQRQQFALAHAGRVAAIGELSSGIIHEISQPLYSVSNFSGACRRTLEGVEFEESAEVAGYLDQVTQATKTAQEIVNRLRGYLKHQDVQQSAVELHEAIEDALRLLAFEIRNRRVTVDCDVAPGTTVFIDPVQIHQVLVNLILNACEAMNSVSKDARRIQIRASIAENEVEVTVEDNGIGMSQEVAQHLFEPFFSTKAEGLGMGMSVTQNIISQNGGTIWFTSPPHTGTVIHFTLPVFRSNQP